MLHARRRQGEPKLRRFVVGVGVNDCDAFVATVRIAEIVEVLGINGSVVL